MTLYEEIIKIYPELESDNSVFMTEIILQDDSDGVGAYIKEWNSELPLPEGMVVGKPEVVVE